MPQVLDPFFAVWILDFEKLRSLFDDLPDLAISLETELVARSLPLCRRRVDVLEESSYASCDLEGCADL